MVEVEQRQVLLRRLAEIAEQKLVDQVAAFDWWAKAVNEDPSSELALDELLRLVRATHQWDAFVATMSEAASAGPAAAGAARRAAAPRGELRGRPRGSRARRAGAGRRCCSEHPKDAAALASLDRIYETQGMYDNLSAVLKQRIAITDSSEELVKLHLRLGRVYAEALEDVEGAIASYLAVLEHESRSPEALEALERLYFRGERWPELYGVYEKLVDIAKDDATLAECYSRMAKLASDALDERAEGRRAVGPRGRSARQGHRSRSRASPICTRRPASGKS